MLCDDLEGWDGVGSWKEVQEGGTSVYLIVVSQGMVGNRLESQARPLFLIDLG